jgi:hypothetical protein
MALLLRLVFPDTPARCDVSGGLLTLRLPDERPAESSLFIPLREVSRSLNALTVTGATEGVTGVGSDAFAILGMPCALAVVDLEVDNMVAEDLEGRT